MEPIRKYIVGIYTAAFDLNRKDETRVEDKHGVYFDGGTLLIDKDPRYFLSSDFDWGSRGIGVKQTARSILMEITDPYDAVRFTDPLVEECLSAIPAHYDFSIQIHAVREWVKFKKGQSSEEITLLFWTKIEDPHYRSLQPKPAPEKKPLVIPPPPFKNTMEIPSNGGNVVKERKTKYPFGTLEVGQYFYFINPNHKDLKTVSASQGERTKKLGREFTRRVVSAEWARDHGIEVAQNVDVCIVWRTK